MAMTAAAAPARVSPPAGRRTRLTDLRSGQTGIVYVPSSNPGDAAVLRAMGLRPRTRVRVCRRGEPCIVCILGSDGERACRIGLARVLASQVEVEVA